VSIKLNDLLERLLDGVSSVRASAAAATAAATATA